MSIVSNFHTHTTYCDGVNSPQEMVEAALEKGFHALGFTGHAFTSFDTTYCMTPIGSLAYKQDIKRLEEEFTGRIQIYLGLENDAGDPQDSDGYDYIIGSAHYLFKNGSYYSVDNTPEILRDCIDAYGGDAMEAVKAYYRLLSEFAQHTKPDILGHFDVITKFNTNNRFFDAESPAYHRIALEALDAVVDCGAIVELNTGGMARGYTTVPYPAPFLLKRLFERNAPLVVSSDAHSAAHLDAHFATARTMLLDMGFTQIMEFTRAGFVPVSLV